MKGFQMSCRGKLANFDSEKTFFNNKVYLRRDAITDEKKERFKDNCVEGGGLYDLDRTSTEITIHEIEVVE